MVLSVAWPVGLRASVWKELRALAAATALKPQVVTLWDVPDAALDLAGRLTAVARLTAAER